MMIPRTAPVRPRVIAPGSGETFLLEDIVVASAEASRTGTLRIVGPAGSGKTTALGHLSAILSPSLNVECLDDAEMDVVRSRSVTKFVVFCSKSSSVIGPVRKLATWTNDDLIEYLLAVHPNHVQSIYPRVAAAPDRLGTGGCPEIWKIILDEFSRSDSVASIVEALTAASHRATPVGMSQEDVNKFCLLALRMDEKVVKTMLAQLTREYGSGKDGEEHPLNRLVRHRVVQTVLAADAIAQQLKRATPLPPDIPNTYALVSEVSRRIESDAVAIDTLRQQADQSTMQAPFAASVLHECAIDWRPKNRSAYLVEARLCGANWDGIKLEGAHLHQADLSESELNDSALQDVRAEEVQLSGASFERACVWRSSFLEADLQGANCKRLSAQNVNFLGANLRSADFSFALLQRCCLVNADFRDARFLEADLTSSELTGANLEGADFRNAIFHYANVERQILRHARLDGADFCDARMVMCDLEYVRLNRVRFIGADLTGAHLTGSTIVQADFRAANLMNTGLGEIDWENADLRDANLVGCSFHMGSTRCGLVDSPYPSKGTRTGFYTDDYDDQYFKSPEEIRKANLRGADLRGADITDVDFYLVDLRDARYDEPQRRHLQSTGAILQSRV